MDSILKNIPDISFIDDATIEEVMSQMISDYQTKYKEITGKDISLGQADPYRLIMYACSIQLYQAMQYADYAAKMGLLKYSHGEYLDNLTPLRGVVRNQATAATTILEFSIENAIASAVSIPAGTRVTNGNDIYFATDEYAEIKAGKTSITVTATCTTAGACGNNFSIGELCVMVNTLPYITKVTNTVTTYGGADTEDDDSLRERTYSKPNSYSTAGPDGAYEFHTKEADPSIEDVVVDSPSAGVVDVRFICEGGLLPDEAMIQKVTDYLTDRKVRPLTDCVIVQAPETRNYDVSLTYYIPSSMKSAVAMIQSDVNTAVTIYNTWQTEKIGRDINPSYLIQKIMEAGAKRVVVDSPVFTVLERTTIAQTGTVSITYGGLEDD